MKLLSVDRVAFSLFGMDVYWYGIIITSAIVLDFMLLLWFCKKYDYDKDMPFDLVLSAVLLGILGARIFSVIFEPGLGIADFFAFREGGMSIIGALIGGLVGVGIYSWLKKVPFFMVTDVLAPLVILAQSIGRWGNFFNSEVYGREIVDPSLQWFPFAVEVGGNWYQALFFYESMLNLIGFGILLFLFSKFRTKRGIVTGSYLIFYGVIRFLLEPLRDPEFILQLGVLPISQVLSGIMVVAGLSIVLTVILKNKKQKAKV